MTIIASLKISGKNRCQGEIKRNHPKDQISKKKLQLIILEKIGQRMMGSHEERKQSQGNQQHSKKDVEANQGKVFLH